MAGLIGGRLAPHAKLTLLGSWKEGLDALRKQGIRLEQNGHVEHARVKVAADPADCVGAQTALVLVKSWQSERAANMLADCLAPDGVALTLQNGLGNIETLEARIGRDRAALGVTTAGATLLGPGRVRDGGAGATHVVPHPRLAPLVDLLQRAGIAIYPADDIEGLVWGKLAINAGINPLTALLEVPNGELIVRSQARSLMAEAALEVASVAEARGIRLPYANPVEQIEQVARRTADNDSSMLQDIRRGAPTEIDAINGAVVREGQRLGVSAPVNRILWKLVQTKACGTWRRSGI